MGGEFSMSFQFSMRSVQWGCAVSDNHTISITLFVRFKTSTSRSFHTLHDANLAAAERGMRDLCTQTATIPDGWLVQSRSLKQGT